jgi:outer membrane protein
VLPAGAQWANGHVAGTFFDGDDMSKKIGFVALALALAVPAAWAQDSGNWLVRGRALNLQSANKDSTGLNLSVNDKTFPEIDFSYFYTPNFAVELVLTYPQKHDIRSGGTNIGTLKHLPPSLLAQYHFAGLGAARPYVGAGINVTLFSSVSFNPAVEAALHPTIKKSSTGLALQVGVDVPVGGGWLVNLDVKKVQIKTDVSSSGTKVGTFKVDPTLVSLGVGKRF